MPINKKTTNFLLAMLFQVLQYKELPKVVHCCLLYEKKIVFVHHLLDYTLSEVLLNNKT